MVAHVTVDEKRGLWKYNFDQSLTMYGQNYISKVVALSGQQIQLSSCTKWMTSEHFKINIF